MLRPTPRCLRAESLRIEAIESLQDDTLGQSHRHRLPGQSDERGLILLLGQDVGDGIVGQGRGEEEGGVGQLPPEKAEDVLGEERIGFENPEELVNTSGPDP